MTATLFLHPDDVRGMAQLAVDGVDGTSRLVEELHGAIARLSAPIGESDPTRTTGVTGLVYRSIRGINALVGSTTAMLSAPIVRRLPLPTSSREREHWLAALNGVLGDHLAETGNPLAIPMRLRSGGQALALDTNALSAAFPSPGRRLLVAAHGLGMNDLQWGSGSGRRADGLPSRIARSRGWTPLYLHYNTGRALADNGHEFAKLLERLVARWPVPVTEIAIVGHSMGGLVARSAVARAAVLGHRWPDLPVRLVTLGTPHHGAALERLGRGVERGLGFSPYLAPFARLGRLRSAGIKDLGDGLRPTRAEQSVSRFAVAATARGHFGDGLVSVDSALGRHADQGCALNLPQDRCRVVPGVGHVGMLRSPEVLRVLGRWLH